MSQDLRRVVDNLAKVNNTIAAAAERSGRQASDVCLVAVSKYLSVTQTRLLIDAGCQDLGENRPQQLWQKADAAAAEAPADRAIRWHMIGHLQRNKLKRTLPYVHLVHSIDSVSLWDAVDRWAIQAETVVRGLIEVNVSGDANKHGFSPDEITSVLSERDPGGASSAPQHGLQLQGLMGMASFDGGAAQAQRDFAAMRELRDRLAAKFPAHATWTQLSMGMSGDYEQAIAEGSTLVRVGSALIEGVSRDA